MDDWSNESDEYDYDEIIAETDAAWCLRMSDTGEGTWFPKSQCEIDDHNMVVEVPNWLAEKKELI